MEIRNHHWTWEYAEADRPMEIYRSGGIRREETWLVMSIASDEAIDVLLEDWRYKGPACCFSGMITIPKYIFRSIFTSGS